MSVEKRRPKTFESDPIYIHGSQHTVDFLASEAYRIYSTLLQTKRNRKNTVLYQTFYTKVCEQFPEDKELVGLLLPSLFQLFQNTLFTKKKKRKSKKTPKADVVSSINCWTQCFRRFMSWRRH